MAIITPGLHRVELKNMTVNYVPDDLQSELDHYQGMLSNMEVRDGSTQRRNPKFEMKEFIRFLLLGAHGRDDRRFALEALERDGAVFHFLEEQNLTEAVFEVCDFLFEFESLAFQSVEFDKGLDHYEAEFADRFAPVYYRALEALESLCGDMDNLSSMLALYAEDGNDQNIFKIGMIRSLVTLLRGIDFDEEGNDIREQLKTILNKRKDGNLTSQLIARVLERYFCNWEKSDEEWEKLDMSGKITDRMTLLDSISMMDLEAVIAFLDGFRDEFGLSKGYDDSVFVYRAAVERLADLCSDNMSEILPFAYGRSNKADNTYDPRSYDLLYRLVCVLKGFEVEEHMNVLRPDWIVGCLEIDYSTDGWNRDPDPLKVVAFDLYFDSIDDPELRKAEMLRVKRTVNLPDYGDRSVLQDGVKGFDPFFRERVSVRLLDEFAGDEEVLSEFAYSTSSAIQGAVESSVWTVFERRFVTGEYSL